MPNRKALIEYDETLALEVCVDGIPEPKGSRPVVQDDREDACLSIYHRMTVNELATRLDLDDDVVTERSRVRDARFVKETFEVALSALEASRAD
jgi:hypothetical protein